MATVTKPLALNESLNSTENTPRNIADILAEELSNIAYNVKPNAGDIPYSNTSSGLSANNVQDAIDEVGTVISLSENVLAHGDTFTVSDEVNKILQSGKFLLQIFVNDRTDNPSARRFSLYGKVGHQLITGYGDRANPSIGTIRFQYSNKTFTFETYQQIYSVNVNLIVL